MSSGWVVTEIINMVEHYSFNNSNSMLWEVRGSIRRKS